MSFPELLLDYLIKESSLLSDDTFIIGDLSVKFTLNEALNILDDLGSFYYDFLSKEIKMKSDITFLKSYKEKPIKVSHIKFETAYISHVSIPGSQIFYYYPYLSSYSNDENHLYHCVNDTYKRLYIILLNTDIVDKIYTPPPYCQNKKCSRYLNNITTGRYNNDCSTFTCGTCGSKFTKIHNEIFYNSIYTDDFILEAFSKYAKGESWSSVSRILQISTSTLRALTAYVKYDRLDRVVISTLKARYSLSNREISRLRTYIYTR